jgi:hypothetical protein
VGVRESERGWREGERERAKEREKGGILVVTKSAPKPFLSVTGVLPTRPPLLAQLA